MPSGTVENTLLISYIGIHSVAIPIRKLPERSMPPTDRPTDRKDPGNPNGEKSIPERYNIVPVCGFRYDLIKEILRRAIDGRLRERIRYAS